MLGSLVGAALKIGGSIFGGIKASQAIKKMKQNVQDQMRENQDWYDRRYNEDATQRADAQALLNKTEESIRSRNRQAAGQQAVMGGTEEAAAAAKEANNKVLADVTTNIAANADARKDQIEQQFMGKKSALNNQLNNFEQQKAQAITQAAGAVGDVGGSLLEADDYFGLAKDK